MADVPRLEIALDTPTGPAVLRLNVHVITLDGDSLTPTESELAAITVACHRRGWVLHPIHNDVDVWWWIMTDTVATEDCDTPAEAYSRALSAHTPEERDGN